MRSLILIGEASSAMTTSPSAGAPTSGISTTFMTSAGLPNASIWIACMIAPSLVMYYGVRNGEWVSIKQFQGLIQRGADAGRFWGILREHHQPQIDCHDRVS